MNLATGRHGKFDSLQSSKRLYCVCSSSCMLETAASRRLSDGGFVPTVLHSRRLRADCPTAASEPTVDRTAASCRLSFTLTAASRRLSHGGFWADCGQDGGFAPTVLADCPCNGGYLPTVLYDGGLIADYCFTAAILPTVTRDGGLRPICLWESAA